ncbi:hypothetical protein [Nocardia transvalensis]|uniref:hypothetical protein n=1 Tax=Nocardia transvalensis TaxID=37333 RepID=UPI0018938044|nr:hypothetical protein [Nocardia transvalensis]MBF6331763.1 hypothetical protein [Nocardia transvalensis]
MRTGPWRIFRDARRRADRGPYREKAAGADRGRIRAAIQFLDWLETLDTPLNAVSQHHIDAWFDTHRTKHQTLVAFLRWLRDRHLVADIEIPTTDHGLPQHFQTRDQHQQQLRRCLTDPTLPLEVRVVGALVRLYAVPLTQLVELTIDQFHRTDTSAHLILDRHRTLLPPSLAQLVDDLALRPGADSLTRGTAGISPRYLLPGRPPSRPRNPYGLANLMRRHGLPLRVARNTAMITAMADLPATVAADILGIAPNTAAKWARYAQTDWAHYLSHHEQPSANSANCP